MGKRDFLSILDLSKEEIFKIFDLSKMYKSKWARREIENILRGRTIGLIFNKPSTRTRTSFEVAICSLGGNTIYLEESNIQISRGETIKDTSNVLSKYLDGLVIRTYSHSEVEEFAKWCNFPVINALTDLLHPCQILSDYFTIFEKFGKLSGLKLTYIGDGNNVCNSLILGGDLLGVEVRVICPDDYMPSEKILKMVKNKIRISNNPYDFIEDTDILYTDTWISMGDEKEKEKRLEIFKKYQVNSKLIAKIKTDFIFMHCLPAHRNWEVTDEIIDGKNSIVYTQAENRLHCQKGLLHFLYSFYKP
ncbi:MAG TPA: ornithine carbamoyltransferase [bacterium]|nr:ornithine carbamoyltransferase [bacterium]